jgi:4-diphosphocytidyl-2-C-methyl-D-erythritol kinase
MAPVDQPVTLTCPAKVNLSLAVLGPRKDGFHALHSVVAQTSFGDELTLEWNPDGPVDKDVVVVQDALLPEADNSVRRAIQAYRRAAGFTAGAYTATLIKRIPVGAGLGGGSSDAVAALKALRQLHGPESPDVDWSMLAAGLGSDCPLFLNDKPVVMEGRGEQLTPLEPGLAARFRGKRIVLFKPRFSVETAEAYRRLAAAGLYQKPERVRQLMADWRASDQPLPPRLNDFERLMEIWIPSLAIFLQRLRELHGLDARLSGSGSACFAFSPGDSSAKSQILEEARRAWGESCWIEEAVLH